MPSLAQAGITQFATDDNEVNGILIRTIHRAVHNQTFRNNFRIWFDSVQQRDHAIAFCEQKLQGIHYTINKHEDEEKDGNYSLSVLFPNHGH